jgi:hypothetical protein
MSENFPEHKWKERDEFNDIFVSNDDFLAIDTAITMVSTA